MHDVVGQHVLEVDGVMLSYVKKDIELLSVYHTCAIFLDDCQANYDSMHISMRHPDSESDFD